MKIRTFLDTGVLIAACQSNTAFGIAALSLLDDPQRAFVASLLLKLELLPQPTFHQRQDEVEFYQAFFDTVSLWQPMNDQLVLDAMHEASQHTLSAMDALHVVTARNLHAVEFITTEKPDKPIYQIQSPKIISLSSLPLPT